MDEVFVMEEEGSILSVQEMEFFKIIFSSKIKFILKKNQPLQSNIVMVVCHVLESFFNALNNEWKRTRKKIRD